MHIELTEMLRCPEPHRDAFLVLSTGEMRGRMVRSGVLGCPVCGREYRIVSGVADFSESGMGDAAGAMHGGPTPRASGVARPDEAEALQALLDLGGPGGYVVLLGAAVRHAAALADRMWGGGIHFVGVNPPAGTVELPVLSLVACARGIPLRNAMARAVVVGEDCLDAPWPAEAARVLLRGRRFVVEREDAPLPPGVTRLAAGRGLAVGERR